MAIETVDAVVMRSFALRDTSRIVHLFTAERGRVKVVAKGARAPGNRFGSALEPFTRIQAIIYYNTGRDLQLLSKAEIVTPRRILGRSLLRYAYAGAVLELLDQLLIGEEANLPLFGLVDETMTWLETCTEGELRHAFMRFVIRAMAAMGYQPELDRCLVCHSEVQEAAAFEAHRGGLVCRRCAARSSIAGVALTTAALTALRALVVSDDASAFQSSIGDEVARVLDSFMRAHIPRYRRPRSLELVRAGSASD